MAKYLVIVESPAKVKTIKKFLGKNYEVAVLIRRTTLNQNILRYAEKAIFWRSFEKRSKRQTRSIWQLTRTAREKPFRGIYTMH